MGAQQTAFLSKLSKEQRLLGSLQPGEGVSFASKTKKGAVFAAAGCLLPS